jgi:TATA-box binding protein (TBP) (component of TFIID and TFIIIB)
MVLMDHERVENEPEAFPGHVCRITDPKVVFLLFSSGKIISKGERPWTMLIQDLTISWKKSVLLSTNV